MHSVSSFCLERLRYSFDILLEHDDYQLQVAQPQQSSSRPGTSLGKLLLSFSLVHLIDFHPGLNDNGVGARRIAPEERERQDMEYKSEPLFAANPYHLADKSFRVLRAYRTRGSTPANTTVPFSDP
jgi:hypothetical protein